MKIALCFSGQARSFEKGFEYYKKNLLDHYDVDVYIHSWQFDEQIKLQDLYKPVAFVTEKNLETDADTKYINTPNAQKYPPRFTYSALYSINECRMMMNTHIKYDWVIKTRTDYALNVKIPFEQLDNTKLYIPNCRMVPEHDFGNDQFAFGSQDTMNKYMSTFENLDKYYSAGAVFIGENMMQANLHEHNLYGANLVYVNMNNPFPPGRHNGTWHSLIRDDYEQWTKNS
jgi:hypothetical protein